MLDAERCRGTASKYAKLADAADRALVRRACQNLERLWLELADVSEKPDVRDQGAVQKRRAVLMANIDSQRRLTSH